MLGDKLFSLNSKFPLTLTWITRYFPLGYNAELREQLWTAEDCKYSTMIKAARLAASGYKPPTSKSNPI